MELKNVDFNTYFKTYPDKNGYFGKYGGSFIQPELQAAMDEITEAYMTIAQSRRFIAELRRIRVNFRADRRPFRTLSAFRASSETFSFTSSARI